MSLLTDKIKEIISVESLEPNLKYSPGDRKACIISICSQKGGVGKTTTAVNLGSALARFFHKKVLICDLDPQGHVEKSIGAIMPEGVEYTPLSNLLTSRKANLIEGIIQTEIENLSITPGDKNLYETENILAAKIGKEFILAESLKTARTHYDIILFDCPPNLGNLTLNGLVASDFCLVPCEMSVLAFEGVSDLVETLDTVNERLNKNLSLLGVVMTRVDTRNTSMNRVIEENLRNYFKNKILKTQIGINTSLNKAQLEGRPIFDFAPNSTGAADYKALAEEIVRKLKRSSSPSSLDSESNSIQAASA